jgi:hypothetical protein
MPNVNRGTELETIRTFNGHKPRKASRAYRGALLG